MIYDSLMAGAVGGLLWLDRFQLCQFMISRPIVSASIVGWIMGDITVGVASGVIFELLWLRRPPVGGFIAPDVTLASIATAAVSAGVRSSVDVGIASVVFLSFLVLLPVCFIGKKMDEILRLGLGKIARIAEKSQINGRDRAVGLYFLSALVLGFSAASLVLVPTILCFTFLLTLHCSGSCSVNTEGTWSRVLCCSAARCG
jgi:mannose/fructose/N-acetylgalactosamine-specific phosphotransferase system component IIC